LCSPIAPPPAERNRNSSGLVGQFFLDTLLAEITVRFDDRIDAYQGPADLTRVWNFSPPES